MIKLDVLSMLKRHGKTKYWLYKQLGMSYQNFNRMINNETRSIRYETLNAMCGIFGCTPNDLLLYDEERLQNCLPPGCCDLFAIGFPVYW